MAKKTTNKCVHMTETENERLEEASLLMDRSVSQIIHDALVATFFKPGGVEQHLAESRLEQARGLVTDSLNSGSTFDFLRSESADDADQTRFSRLMARAERPEVLHG